MFGNGVRTGKETTIVVPRSILLDHRLALAAWAVAVAGATTRRAAVCRFVAAAFPTMGQRSRAALVPSLA